MQYKQGEFPIEERYWILEEATGEGRLVEGVICINIGGFLHESNEVTNNDDDQDKCAEFMLASQEIGIFHPFIQTDPIKELKNQLAKMSEENVRMKESFAASFKGLNKRMQSIEGVVKNVRDNNTRMMGNNNN